jgi:hypothetical protein
VLSLSLALGRKLVWPSAEVTVNVPGTSVVSSIIGTPFVLILTMGKLMADAAGANEELDIETVTDIGDVACWEPATPTTLAEAVQLVCIEGAVGGKPSCPADTEAFSISVADVPLVNVTGATVIPEGKPVSVTAIGPE